MSGFRYEPGDRPLEGYTIERAIGAGGFGEVYLARSDGGREVALKAVLAGEQIELRGIGHCMNLKNPHLVTIHDVRHDAAKRPWVIMEYIAGPSLADLLAEHPNGMGEAKAAYLVREIAKGLGFLHEHGIVHRDLKPGNVFYDDGCVKICDYGLAKAIGPSLHSGQTTTVGTVHYMAPEIGAGRYDRSIDIYALGVMLYEMLTGQQPFRGQSPGEILMKHLSAEADMAGIAEPFATVIRRSIVKDPAQRYQSVGEMVEALFEAEGIQQSVSGIRGADLSVAAGRVAVRGATAVATPPPLATSNPSPPDASFEDLPPSERPGANPQPSQPPTEPKTDPMPTLLRLALAGGTVVLVAFGLDLLLESSGAISGVNRTFEGVGFMLAGAVGSTLAAWYGFAAGLTRLHPMSRNMLLSALAGAGGWLFGWPGGLASWGFFTLGVYILLNGVDHWKLVDPERPKRIGFGAVVKATVLGLCSGLLVYHDSLEAILLPGLLGGYALAVQAGAPWGEVRAVAGSIRRKLVLFSDIHYPADADPDDLPEHTVVFGEVHYPATARGRKSPRVFFGSVSYGAAVDAVPVGSRHSIDLPSRRRVVPALAMCAVGFLPFPFLAGLHRFYAGKIGTGLLWLVTGGLFGIGQVIDLVLIATGSFRDAEGRRLANWSEGEAEAASRAGQRVVAVRPRPKGADLFMALLAGVALLVSLACAAAAAFRIPEMMANGLFGSIGADLAADLTPRSMHFGLVSVAASAGCAAILLSVLSRRAAGAWHLLRAVAGVGMMLWLMVGVGSVVHGVTAVAAGQYLVDGAFGQAVQTFAGHGKHGALIPLGVGMLGALVLLLIPPRSRWVRIADDAAVRGVS